MTNPKRRQRAQNQIEEAIGNRTKSKEFQEEPIPQSLEQAQIPDEPSHQEMLSLEELNRRTEERLRDEEPPQETVLRPTENYQKIPVSKPNLLPVTKISSQESPPQKIDVSLESVVEANRKQNEINERTPSPLGIGKVKTSPTPEYIEGTIPAEEVELTALRKYILEDGFPVSAVAFHIVTLCSQPLVVTSTTTWDFRDRANIPEMVFALLHQPGYIEGVWPSLKIIMGSNAGNPAWSAGVLMTIALFDVVRTLPALKELKELENAS